MPQDFRSRIILSAKSNVDAAFDKASRASGKVNAKLNTLAKNSVIAGAALAAAFGANAIRLQTEFAAAVSDLSAITGAVGKDLDILSDAAKEFGKTTTLSATEAAEAFKLVASAKPDLLENAAALKEVTGQAILLSEASGTTLANAATTVGNALNQFGEDADQAARFVNVLAAGSKFGASEVEKTALALKNAGVAAASAGIGFEQTNAAIQTLGAVGIKGAEAGTALRSIFIKLQTQANDQFNPAVVGLSEALENLSEAELTATDLTTLFGQEQFAIATALIDNRENFDNLTEAITGTNTATEQAEARNDNFAGDLKKLNSAFEALSIEVAENWEPTLRAVTQILTALTVDLATTTAESDDLKVSFEFLDKTFRVVLSTMQVIDTVFEGIGTRIGGLAAAVTLAAQGEFSAAAAVFEQNGKDVAATYEQGFLQAAATLTEKTKQAIIAPIANPEVIVKAMEAGVAVGEAVATGIQTAGQQAAETAAAKELEAFELKLARVRDQNVAESTIIAEQLELNLALIADARERDLLNLNEFLEIKFNLESNAQAKLKKLEEKNLTDAQKFTKLTAVGKTKFVLGQLQALTQGTAQENKVLFRINQAAAIGNAVVNTAQAITSALAVQPFPVGLALAAVAAAAGAAQIGAIASAKPGSGTTPSVSGTTPTLGGQPVQGITPPSLDEIGGEGGGPGRDINIQIQGIPEAGVMPAESVRELMRSINEELGDGTNLNVSGGQGGGV